MCFDYMNLDGEDIIHFLGKPQCAHIHVDHFQVQKWSKFHANVWRCKDCGQLFAPIPKNEYCYEDQLPEMTEEEHSQWFENSFVIDGVRMGFKRKTTPPEILLLQKILQEATGNAKATKPARPLFAKTYRDLYQFLKSINKLPEFTTD